MASAPGTFRFQMFQEEARKDILCGKLPFSVAYRGSTCWDDHFTDVEEVLADATLSLLHDQTSLDNKSLQHRVVFHIDHTGVSIYTDDEIERLVERFALRRMKEIIYCSNIKKYSKHVILVADSCDGEVHAHILACDNTKNAKCLYKALTDVFTQRHVVKQKPEDDVVNEAAINVSFALNEEPQKTTLDIEDISLDGISIEDGFTNLARSRSFSKNDGKQDIGRTSNRKKHLSHS